MRVYHFDADTGVFTGHSSEADASPLEPGVFLIPAHATDRVPPPLSMGEQARFADENWLREKIPPPPKTPLRELLKAVPKHGFGGKTIYEIFRDNKP
jgi:hypothetical protein